MKEVNESDEYERVEGARGMIDVERKCLAEVLIGRAEGVRKMRD